MIEVFNFNYNKKTKQRKDGRFQKTLKTRLSIVQDARTDSGFSGLDEHISMQIERNQTKNILNYFNTFSFYWCLLINIFHLYMLLSSVFWMSNLGYPSGPYLSIEIVIEMFVIVDIILRIAFSKYARKNKFFFTNFILNEVTVQTLFNVLYVISAIPQATILKIIKTNTNIINEQNLQLEDYLSYLFALNIIKVLDLWNFFQKLEFIFIYTQFRKIIYIKFIKTCLMFFMLIHYIACSWTFVNKIEKTTQAIDGYYFQNLDESGDYNIANRYILSIQYAIEVISGNSTNEVVPGTKMEITLSVLMMGVGTFVLGTIYANFDTLLYYSNFQEYKQRNSQEKTRKFCRYKNLKGMIFKNINNYFNRILQSKNDYKNQLDIIQLPMSLQVELKLHLNQDLIKNVKLLNLGSPDFILETMKYFYPKICMKGDIVIWYGEIANEMYFIKKGKVQIITECNSRVIAIQEEGSYFGEIGLLITGKRTCIVQAIEDCIFMCLNKEHFNLIMQQFPDQKNHLIKVSKQRLLTTKASDLPSDKIIEKVEFEEKKREDSYDISGVSLFIKNNHNNKNHNSQEQNVIQIENVNKQQINVNINNKQQIVDLSMHENINSNINNNNKVMGEHTLNSKPLLQNSDNAIPNNSNNNNNNNNNLNDIEKNQGNADYFNQQKQQTNQLERLEIANKKRQGAFNVIYNIANKRSFQNVWKGIMFFVLAYNLMYVPLSIAYSVDLEGGYITFEYLSFTLYFLDIIFFANTSSLNEKEKGYQKSFIQTNQYKSIEAPSQNADQAKKQLNSQVKNKHSNKDFVDTNKSQSNQNNFSYKRAVDKYFKKNLFIVDMLSTFPLDVMLSLLHVHPILCRITRLLRLARIYRVSQFYNSLYSRVQFEKAFLFLKFFLVMAYISHLCACLFYIIAVNELGRVSHNLFTRFDSQAIPSRTPLAEQSFWVKYIEFLYYSLNLTSQGCFGTIQGMSQVERCVQTLVLLCSRIITIFFIAQALNSEKMNKTLSNEAKSKIESIRGFLNFKKFPHQISNRIYKFYDFQNIKFKGINDEEILSELPNTVQNEIILQLFQNVLQKIQTNQAKDSGVVLSLMRMMKQKIIPKDEYVFKKGEIATEMYFIIEGQATVMIEDEFYIKPPIILAQLKEGDYFGEMAIIDLKINVRGASVVAKTNLHLASLDIKDFKYVCNMYPEIFQIIQQLADQRKLNTKEKMKQRSHKSLKLKQENDSSLEEDKKMNPSVKSKKNEDQKSIFLRKPDQKRNYFSKNKNQGTNQDEIISPYQQQDQNIFSDENNKKIFGDQNQLSQQSKQNLLVLQSSTQKENNIASLEDQIDSLNLNKKKSDQNTENINGQSNQQFGQEKDQEDVENENEIQLKTYQHMSSSVQHQYEKQQSQLLITRDSKKNIFNEQDQDKTQSQIKNSCINNNHDDDDDDANGNNKNKKEDDYNMADYNQDQDENVFIQKRKKQKTTMARKRDNQQNIQDDYSLDLKDSIIRDQSKSITNQVNAEESQSKTTQIIIQKNDNQISDQEQLRFQEQNMNSQRKINLIDKNENQRKRYGDQSSQRKENHEVENSEQDCDEQNKLQLVTQRLQGLNEESKFDVNQQTIESCINHYKINNGGKKAIQSQLFNDNKELCHQDYKKNEEYNVKIIQSEQRCLDQQSCRKSDEEPNQQQSIRNHSFSSDNYESQLEVILKQSKDKELSIQDKREIDSPSIFKKNISQSQNKRFFIKRKSQSVDEIIQVFNQDNVLENGQLDSKKNKNNNRNQSDKISPLLIKEDRILEDSSDLDNSSSLSSVQGEVHKIGKSETNLKTSSLIFYTSFPGNGFKKSFNFLILKRHSFIMVLVSVYSSFITPLNIAFESFFCFKQNIPLLIIEILSTLVLISFTFQEFRRFSLKLKKMKKKKQGKLIIDIYDQYLAVKKVFQKKLLINIFVAIPFSLLFDLTSVDESRNNFFLIVLSLNRVLNIYNIYYSIRYYDQNQQVYIEIINKFMIIAFLNHLNACLWIVIGKQETDWKKSWFVRISTTQVNEAVLQDFQISDFSLYLNALSWSFQIMTHTTTGDSSAVNTREEIYSCIIFLCVIVFSISFFASISSLIKIISSSLKRDFLMRYRLVVAFIKKMDLKQFKPLVEIYFSYIWETMMGMDENKFLKEFPIDLRADIIEYMYPKLIKYSIFFNIGPKWRNEQVKLSIFRFLTFEIFMPNEVIIVAGEECKDVFIILEGQVECYNFELYKMLSLETGDFFGGILNNIPSRIKQPAYVKTSQDLSHCVKNILKQIFSFSNSKICKVGRLSFQDFEIISKAFPEWYQKLKDIQNERYLTLMKRLKFFNNPQNHKAKRRSLGEEENLDLVKDSQQVFDFGNNDDEQYEIKDDLLKEYKHLKIQFQQYDESNSLSQSESQPVISSNSSENHQNDIKSLENKKQQKLEINNRQIKSLNQDKAIDSNRSQSKPKANQIAPQVNFNSLISNSPTSVGQKLQQSQKKQKFLDFIQRKMNQDVDDSEKPAVQMYQQHKTGHIMNNIQSQLNNNLIIVKSLKKQRSPIFNLPRSEQLTHETFFTDAKDFDFKKYPNDEISLIVANFNNVYRLLKDSNWKIKLFFHPTGDLKQNLDYIYITIVSIYLLYVPITIGFMHCCNFNAVVVVEIIYFMFQLSHIFMQLKTPPYLNGSIYPDQNYIYKLYIQQRKHIYDSITILPLNLIIFTLKDRNFIDETTPQIIKIILDIVRLNSLLNYKYLFEKFNKLHSSLRSFSKAFNIIKQVYFFMSVVNVITCIWSWINQYASKYTQDTWMMRFDLQGEQLYIQYLYCVFFVLNTVQSTGYPQMVVTNDLERGAFIVMVITGYTLFAAILGLQLNQQQSLDLKLHDLYITMEKIYNLIESIHMPKGLKKRVDIYFTYLTETNLNDIEEITKIKGMIPATMYNNILYNQTKQNLNQFKVFKDLNNSYLVRQISCFLKQEIFLEGDYIIRKDELGNRMFFLISGKVQVVSENEFQTLKVFTPGQIFGEISLFTDNYKRIASVIAMTVVHVYSINKTDLEPIFQSFPEFRQYIFKQASYRLRDTKQKVEKDEKIKTIYNKFNNFNNKTQNTPKGLVAARNKSKKSGQFQINKRDDDDDKDKQNKLNQINHEEQTKKAQKQDLNQIIIITNAKKQNKNKTQANPQTQNAQKDDLQNKITDKKLLGGKKKQTKTLRLSRKFEVDLEDNNQEVDLLILNNDQDISDIECDLTNNNDEENKLIQNIGAQKNIFNVNKIEVLCSRYIDKRNENQKRKSNYSEYSDYEEAAEGENQDDSQEKTENNHFENIENFLKNCNKDNYNDQEKGERVSFNELVHENEMDFKNHPDIQSRRRVHHNRKNERRLSRINLKKQIKLSKQSEMRLQWGMNLEYN